GRHGVGLHGCLQHLSLLTSALLGATWDRVAPAFAHQRNQRRIGLGDQALDRGRRHLVCRHVTAPRGERHVDGEAHQLTCFHVHFAKQTPRDLVHGVFDLASEPGRLSRQPRYRPVSASATTQLIKSHPTCRPRVATAFPTPAYPYTTTATAMTHWRATGEPHDGAADRKRPIPIHATVRA